MITDAEFWMEIRNRKEGRPDLFKGMLALIHAHQCRLDARVVSLEEEEVRIARYGTERLALLKKNPAAAAPTGLGRDPSRSQAFPPPPPRLPSSPPSSPRRSSALPARAVAPRTIRVLQEVLLYAVPVYRLRYGIPAMSMGWSHSCVVDRPRRQLVTFGAGQGVQVPGALQGRACVAGDGFFAMLTNHNEVWASGGLRVCRGAAAAPTGLGPEPAMLRVATKVVMIAGHGPRLASLSRNFVVRALSAVCAPTRSVIPFRRIRYLDLGYGDDYHMVGTDSVLYKVTASRRAVSTPRRVMSFSQKLVSRVACGMGFLLVIDQSGHLYTSGRNRHGQLGNGGKQETHRRPYLVTTLIHHFITQVAAGEWHSLALTSSGVVYCAGANDNGQLGLGPGVKEVCEFTPVPLPGKCLGIAAGPAGSMFACEGGQILTCGLNDCMQLGLETTNKIVYTPTPVPLLSGVESYTMSFGGYLQPGQPSSPVASNGVMENRKAEFPRKDTDSSIHPLSDKPQSLITNSTIQNGEPIHFNTNNGQGHHPSAKTVLENDSEISPSVNGTGTHEGKPPPAGRPGYPEVANPISGRINITSNNIPNEPIIVSSTDNQASDLPNNPSVPHRKVSSTIRYQYTGKTNKLTCGKCCIVM